VAIAHTYLQQPNYQGHNSKIKACVFLYKYHKQKLEEKIGEALGLEMAAQKAVEEFESKGLLNKHGMKGQKA
jgi:ABC-type Fe2+-enterobactin transport system substrate-binding protein